jgi:hypothetical protein
MPHYVNIALEAYFFGRIFLFAGPGRLFAPTQERAMCRMCVGTKSMTKNKPAGHGAGSSSQKCGSMEDFWELRGFII